LLRNPHPACVRIRASLRAFSRWAIDPTTATKPPDEILRLASIDPTCPALARLAKVSARPEETNQERGGCFNSRPMRTEPNTIALGVRDRRAG
jgi:hypothetical protein